MADQARSTAPTALDLLAELVTALDLELGHEVGQSPLVRSAYEDAHHHLVEVGYGD